MKEMLVNLYLLNKGMLVNLYVMKERNTGILILKMKGTQKVKLDSRQCLKVYLSDRKIKINVNGSLSNTFTMKFRVPQGPVLDPFIFILCASPLVSITEDYVLKYQFNADDTELCFCISLKEQCGCKKKKKVDDRKLIGWPKWIKFLSYSRILMGETIWWKYAHEVIADSPQPKLRTLGTSHNARSNFNQITKLQHQTYEKSSRLWNNQIAGRRYGNQRIRLLPRPSVRPTTEPGIRLKKLQNNAVGLTKRKRKTENVTPTLRSLQGF